MAKNNEKFEHESIQDNETVGAYLESLIEGFKKGKITLSTENKHIELRPNNILHFNLSAKKKGNKSQLSIKLSWQQSEREENRNGEISIV